MNKIINFYNNKAIFRLSIILFGIWLLHLLLFNNLWIQPDSETYTQAARMLAGDIDATDRLFRLSKPLALFVPAVLYRLGMPIEWGFLLQQWCSYGVACVALYCLYKNISNSAALASYGVLMYASCQPVGVYGQAVLVDMLGWAVGIVLMNVIYQWYQCRAESAASLWRLGAWLGICVFIKESILIAGVWLFWLILVDIKWAWQQKIRLYALVASSFAATAGIGLTLTGLYFEKSLLDWFLFNHTDAPKYDNLPVAFLLQTARTLDVYWILVAIGLIFFIKENFNKIDKPLLAMLLAAVSSWLLYPLVWKYMMDRILFMFAPFWIYWAAWLVERWGRGFVLILLFGGMLNLLGTYAIYNCNIPYILHIIFATYLILILRFRYV